MSRGNGVIALVARKITILRPELLRDEVFR